MIVDLVQPIACNISETLPAHNVKRSVDCDVQLTKTKEYWFNHWFFVCLINLIYIFLIICKLKSL